ncbi:hypothetical protein ES705_02062 [subsurface metagenome]
MEQVDSLKTGKKFKKTEIGEIPVDWEAIKLSEIIKYTKGKKPNRIIDDIREGFSPYLSSEFLRGSRAPQYASLSNGIVTIDDGDIILLWDGSNAGEFFKGKKGILSSTMAKIELRTRDINNKYLFYFLKTYEHILSIQTRGTGIPHVDRAVFYQISIPLPPLPEQRKIAEILTTADEAIEKSDEIIEKTKELKKGLMQELFTCGIGHTKFKKTKIGEIPVDWEVSTIKNHTAVITKGTTPSTYGHPYTNQGILFLRIENIDKQGHISFKEVKYISEETDKFLSRSRLQAGDILFSIAGALGRVTVITENLLPANVNQALAIIRLNDNTLNKEYLKYTLQSKIIKTQVNLLAAQLAQANLNLQQVGDIKFPLPNTDEQKKITEILSTVDEDIEKAVDNKKKLETIKKGLMQVLLTGKKRVKV